MLVSIVTVLSRLPSLAATMEAKFSAPAESKATVKKKKRKPPVLIPSVHYLLLSHPPPPPPPPPWLHLFRPCWCNVIWATEMWLQAVYFSLGFSIPFTRIVFLFPHNVFNISFLWKPGFSFFYVSALPAFFFLPPEINRMNVMFFCLHVLNRRCLGLCLIYYERAALLHTNATSCLTLVL